MAISSIYYSFDTQGFKDAIELVLPDVVDCNIRSIKELAETLGSQNPLIWDKLENFRVYQEDLSRIETEFVVLERQLSAWLLIILANFWEPVNLTQADWEHLAPYLRNAGWHTQAIREILLGRTQKALLHPESTHEPFSRPTSYQKWPAWCRFGSLPTLTGWLDESDLTNLLRGLSSARTKIKHNHSPDIESSHVNTVIQVLNNLVQQKRGLFIAVTD